MLTGLDMFCGAGGSSAGARAAGIEMVAAIDTCPIASKTYSQNFPHAQVITAPVETLDLKAVRRNTGNVQIIIASPECTNHSCAKGSAPRNESSRATAMEVLRYARAFNPRWFVLENVVHMRPWTRYPELKKEFLRLGYQLAEQVLDASHFGVPQTRRRLFLVGDKLKEPTLAKQARARKPKGVRSILDPVTSWPMTPLFSDRRAKDTLARAQRAMEHLGPKSGFLIVYYGTDGSGGWQPLDRPLRTITTIDRFALVLPSKSGHMMRMLQVPELKRAMGFPQQYKLDFGTRRERIKLLGNGVCPPVMKAVISALTGE